MRQPREIRDNDLWRRTEALRSFLPAYLRYRDDTAPGSGLEPEEVPDADGKTERDY